jgi:hypothetical protein
LSINHVWVKYKASPQNVKQIIGIVEIWSSPDALKLHKQKVKKPHQKPSLWRKKYNGFYRATKRILGGIFFENEIIHTVRHGDLHL